MEPKTYKTPLDESTFKSTLKSGFSGASDSTVQQAYDAFKTPTPESTPTTAPTAPVYSRYDQSLIDSNKLLSDTVGPPPDKATILQQKKDSADAMIKEIQAQFETALASENKAGAARNDRVRALNISGGLAGSNFASSAAQTQEDKNKGAVDLLNKENAARTASVLAGVDERASEQYQKELATYRASIEGDINRKAELQDKLRNNALNTFSGLASAGVTWDAFKSNEPDAFKQTLSEFGGNEFEAKAAYNNALPDNLKTKYTDKIMQDAQGNAIIHRYGINPISNTLDQYDIPTGKTYAQFTGENGTDVIYQNGTFFSQTKNSDGSITMKPISTTPLTQSQINKNNRVPTPTTNTGKFNVTSTQKTKLLNSGYGVDDIVNIQADLDNGATLEEVANNLTGATPEQKKAFMDAFATKASTGRDL